MFGLPCMFVYMVYLFLLYPYFIWYACFHGVLIYMVSWCVCLHVVFTYMVCLLIWHVYLHGYNCLPETVNSGMEDDISERQKKVEDQPDLHHLDIGCLGEALHHGDEHAGQHQHHSQVDCQGRLEEEGFEIMSDVPDDVEENSGGVHCGYHAQQSSAKPDLNYNNGNVVKKKEKQNFGPECST